MRVSQPTLWAAVALALISSGWAARSAIASGGTYDKDSKSFFLNYIYLDLPSNVLDQSQVNLSVSRTQPQPDQRETVDRFLKRVSDKLSVVTRGRAKIGRLTEVQDVKKADVVISLTGTVLPQAGGAWASLRGFEQGGTLNLYYQDLKNAPNPDDIANTVVHELCHYFFGLPDEYPSGSSRQRLCPLVAPGDARCLMDNFHYGFLGRLCGENCIHNPSAPGSNGTSTVEPRASSCEQIVTAFFDRYDVKPDPNNVEASADTGVDPTKPRGKELTSDQKAAVLGGVRDTLAKLKAQRNGGRLTAQDRQVILGKIVTGLLDTLKDQVRQIDVRQVAQDLVGSLILTPLGVPPGLQLIEKALVGKAVDLARDAAQRGLGANDIELKLLDFTKSELAKTPGASPIGEDDLLYIRDLAKQANAGTIPNQPESIEQFRDELLIELYRTLNDIANQIDLPGPVLRNDDLRRIVTGVQQQGRIPNRALGTRFGRRRTVLILPPIMAGSPLFSGIDITPTQGNSEANYNDLRRESQTLFAQLIDRTRITAFAGTSVPNLQAAGGQQDKYQQAAQKYAESVRVGLTELGTPGVRDVFEVDKVAGAEASGNKIPNKVKGGPELVDPDAAAGVYEERKLTLSRLLAVVKDQVERDLVENVVVMVPPGGIPDEFADPIASLGEQFAGKTDLRIDIALVGDATIPVELRNLVTRSKGSILTVTDIDEVGAVSQRLAGEQTQGTWIIIPQQDVLLLNGQKSAPTPPQDFNTLVFQRLQGIRMPHSVRNDGPTNIILRPFYLDDTNDYELIVGLTQPLTIAGLSSTMLPDGKQGNPLKRTKPNSDNFPEPRFQLMPGSVVDPTEIAAYEGGGREPIFAATREIRLDRSKSTDKTLVFRLPATKTGVSTGWFTPVLTLNANNTKDAIEANGKIELKSRGDRQGTESEVWSKNAINFTFSVGTPLSKAQLSAYLIQQGPDGKPVLQPGTIASDQEEAIVTAVLSAGAAVINAEVVGYVQRIDSGTAPIATARVDFKDNGVAPDKAKDDGIYTASIPLEPRRAVSAEYRVFIDGHSVEGKTKFVPAGESIPQPGEEDKPAGTAEKSLLERPAPVFQRATTVHFLVPSNAGQ